MNMKYGDITGDVGPLFGVVSGNSPKYPMYSYERPAWEFWQGVYDGLRDSGKTHEESIEILRSKDVRWMLDAHDDKVYQLGKDLSKVL